MISTIIFYAFALTLLFAATMTVTARNPVHAVLFLILSFTSGAGILLTLGAEFLAFILMIVYVGAIAVLFLFVVMMLHIEGSVRGVLKKEGAVALTVGGVLLAQMLIVMLGWPVQTFAPAVKAANNTRELGRILYTDYAFPFQVSGLILLVAIVGAIVLTLRPRRNIKRQNLHDQLAVDPKEVVQLVNVKTGEGA